jgi:hypothetical protein
VVNWCRRFFLGEYFLCGHQKIHQLKSCFDWKSRTTRKEMFHSINNYMHCRRTVVWTQRNGTHSEVANKPQYPMITRATLNECINMKIIKTRKDYRENWKFSIQKEHFFHSPLCILLFDLQSFYIYDLCRYSPFDFYKSQE